MPKAKLTSEVKSSTSTVNQPFLITLTFKNSGEDWPENIFLACVSGIFEGLKEKFASLPKEGSETIHLPLVAMKGGKQKSYWRLGFDTVEPQGGITSNPTYFGPRVEIEHIVNDVNEETKKLKGINE